jgi:hypothetical protein
MSSLDHHVLGREDGRGSWELGDGIPPRTPRRPWGQSCGCHSVPWGTGPGKAARGSACRPAPRPRQRGTASPSGRADSDTVAAGRGASEAWEAQEPLLSIVATDPPELRRWVVRGDHLVGAVLLGDQRLAEPLRYLIEHETDVTPIREALLAPDGNQAATLLAFAEQARVHSP